MSINIVIANQKGGVGKTTSASSLAHGLALRSRRVLLVDFDPQGQCATALGINQEPGVFNALVNTRSDIHQWIRDTDRTGLYLLPGDRSTATAQIVINAENRPIEFDPPVVQAAGKGIRLHHLRHRPFCWRHSGARHLCRRLVLIPTATEFLVVGRTGADDGHCSLPCAISTIGAGKLAGILPTFYDEQTSESREALTELKTTLEIVSWLPSIAPLSCASAPPKARPSSRWRPPARSSREYEELSEYLIEYS